jgi:hypothetical protein
MLKRADVNCLKISEMDNLVCGSLSWRPLNFNSKPWKTVASGSSVLSHSSFQIRLANMPIEYASVALEYKCFFCITSKELREPSGRMRLVREPGAGSGENESGGRDCCRKPKNR